MYIVRDKSTRRIIHVNPAPVSQQLQGSDIYYQLDPDTMEVGRADLDRVPEHFEIDARGVLVPWPLERLVNEGLYDLPPHLKAQGDEIVEKTAAELIAAGVAPLPAAQDRESSEDMSDAELVAAGLLELDPHSKLDGPNLIPKTLAELVRDQVVSLAPDEEVRGDQIVQLTPRELLERERIDLARYKQAVVERYTELSLTARRKVVPDHQLLYAAVGALGSDVAEAYRKIAADHVKKLEQTTKAIERATSATEVDSAAHVDQIEWQKTVRSTMRLQAPRARRRRPSR